MSKSRESWRVMEGSRVVRRCPTETKAHRALEELARGRPHIRYWIKPPNA